ncbi:MAG: site-specific DNA-methyltransferase [Acidimicrobiia bacterium]|nr:site-specific DNA-methyltransferase [Acidimicrobiia bacterium]
MSRPERRRTSTATSNFGVGRREGHDSSAFYSRFPVPEISEDSEVIHPACVDRLWVGDARDMDRHGDIADSSVALVVTSPPYYAGKEYEEAIGEGHIPASYIDYLEMLHDVFAECVRKLEPGGRIAVNVANLGRRPYRSLSADVIDILQNRLKLLLRGEIIWQKARGASGSCAWGSFQRPGSPVLRDLTERVIIASKGRFDRARRAPARAAANLPAVGSATADEFMEATTDVWEIRAESARRVGHPAPFPVELPQRLIALYTYRGALVRAPFVGAGTTAVAAVRTGRHYVGFDTDAGYLALARQRVEAERACHGNHGGFRRWEVSVPATSNGAHAGDGDPHSRALSEGWSAGQVARLLIREAGFDGIQKGVTFCHDVRVAFAATDLAGDLWRFDVSGGFTQVSEPGLGLNESLWKAIGKATTLHVTDPAPLVLLTTGGPEPLSAGHRALEAVTGRDKPIREVIDLNDPGAALRLATLAGCPA